jgi:ABC-type polysaccharide/polyol phosphate export permease
VAIQFCFILGLAFLVATGNVYYRDTAVILEVVLLAWFFLSPIIYRYEDLTTVLELPGGWTVQSSRLMYILNPMASIMSSYRDALFGSPVGPPAAPRWDFLLRTAASSLVILAFGYWAFARQAHKFGEEV